MQFRFHDGEAQIILDDLTIIRTCSKVGIDLNYKNSKMVLYKPFLLNRAVIKHYDDTGKFIKKISIGNQDWTSIKGLI